MAKFLIFYAIPALITFFLTDFLTKKLQDFFKRNNIVAIDFHKKKKPILPSAGGVPVAFGIVAGLLTFIGLKTFLEGIEEFTLHLLAALSSILLVTFVGFFDDLNVRKKTVRTKKGFKDIRIGLPQWLKPLLTLPAAIPLMVIKAGTSTMTIPFLGSIDFGIFYPLVLIPLGVVGASNLINLLGGFNGVEAGMGIVYTLTLAIIAILMKNQIFILFLITAIALLAFIRYNWYPAKILPGDSLTYLLGIIVANGVILGNMERVGIMVLSPFILEFFLKARSKFKASCLGKLRKDGTLKPPYGKKIYSLTHLVMNVGRFKEKDVTRILILLEVFVSILTLLIFSKF